MATRGETFELPADHPGVHDLAYRERRAAIAAASASYAPGDPVPTVEYTPDEDRLWQLLAAELATKHADRACAAYLAAAERLDLPSDTVPQLGAVSEQLQALTGFRIEPVPGLVDTRTFYGALARRAFLSTQYIRHSSVPYYTPEPDVVHELVGHATWLASPDMAALYQAAGEASVRAETDEAFDFFSRVFWFTIEFGVVWESDRPKAFGAGLLSSFGEIERFHEAEIRSWDIREMGTTSYDITVYQPLLFAASSFPQLVDDLGRFFEGFDDDSYEALLGTSTTE